MPKPLLVRSSFLAVQRILNGGEAKFGFAVSVLFLSPWPWLPSLSSPNICALIFQQPALRKWSDKFIHATLYLPDKIKYSVSKVYLQHTRWKKELSGCEILDHGAGKCRTYFGRGPLLGDSEIILCMRLPSEKIFSGWKYQKPEISSRGEILLHYKQCKGKTTLVFTTFPPRAWYRTMQHGCSMSPSGMPFHSVFRRENYNNEIPNRHSYPGVQTVWFFGMITERTFRCLCYSLW